MTRDRIVWWAVVLLIVLLPILAGVQAATSGSFRHRLDVYGQMLGAPIGLILPLVVVLLSCTNLYRELVQRYAFNTRTRISARRYVGGRLAVVAASAWGVGFIYAFVPFLVSFVVWPWVGDPSVDPAGYGLTAEGAALNSLTKWSYSFLLQFGDAVFGLGYAAWVGLAAASFALLGACCLLSMSHRAAAMAVPLIVYIAGTVGAQLAGQPYLAFAYSVFPHGLARIDPLTAALPILATVPFVIGFVVVVVVRARTNPRLA